MLSHTLCCDTCHRQVSVNDVPRCDKPIPDITRYHTPSNLTRISPRAPPSYPEHKKLRCSIACPNMIHWVLKIKFLTREFDTRPAWCTMSRFHRTNSGHKVEQGRTLKFESCGPKKPDSLHQSFLLRGCCSLSSR